MDALILLCSDRELKNRLYKTVVDAVAILEILEALNADPNVDLSLELTEARLALAKALYYKNVLDTICLGK